MELTELYKGYFQKSKWFLYPNLGIQKSTNFTPINTYIALNDEINEYDEKLIILHEEQNSTGFRLFEKNVLFKNPNFFTFRQCEDNKIAYIFTFEEYSEDWIHFLTGKYSLLSQKLKKRIENFAGKNTGEWQYLCSFLYPERYFALYATLLAGSDREVFSMQETLEEGGELCPPYDLERESLKIKLRESDN